MNTHVDSAPTVQDAIVAVPRQHFLPERAKRYARVNAPVSIGYGQTNSQPFTVELMLELLEIEPGNKILDVGSGSGWTSALLASLTGPSGSVVAVEKVPELVEFGRNNCQSLAVHNVSFHEAKKHVLGWPQAAPYDRILVSAAATQLPQSLVGQLKWGGKMVIPVGDSIMEVKKGSDDRLEIIEHRGFAFVPLI